MSGECWWRCRDCGAMNGPERLVRGLCPVCRGEAGGDVEDDGAVLPSKDFAEEGCVGAAKTDDARSPAAFQEAGSETLPCGPAWRRPSRNQDEAAAEAEAEAPAELRDEKLREILAAYDEASRKWPALKLEAILAAAARETGVTVREVRDAVLGAEEE